MNIKASSQFCVSKKRTSSPAFTIVELLVVIVVIGVLAAITIVSYAGITQKANIASLTSDLDSASRLLKMFNVINGTYPATISANCTTNPDTANNKCLAVSKDTSYVYKQSPTNSNIFCLTATKNNQSYNITPDSIPLAGPCPVLDLDASNKLSYPGAGNGKWYDLSGYDNNGTLNGGVSYSSTNGGVLTFDGTDDYAIVTRPVQDDFTLSFWFKTAQSAGTASAWYSGVGLVDGEVSGVFNDFGTSIGAGKVMFGTGNPDTTVISPSTSNNSTWHFVSAVRVKSSGIYILYVDGVSVGSTTGNTNSLTGSSNITIGCLQTLINYYSGSINDVRAYNSALSASEIQQNFNAIKGRYGL